MRAWGLIGLLCAACWAPTLDDAADCQPETREPRVLVMSPGGDHLAELDWVQGGGAAGYVGFRVSVASLGVEQRQGVFVGKHQVHLAWRSNRDLYVTGCLDDGDVHAFQVAIRRGDFAGVHVIVEPQPC